MSDHLQHAVVDDSDPVSEILETFRAPTGPWEMSRARRLARAARAAALSADPSCTPTKVTVDRSQSGGYVVEIRLVVVANAPPDLGHAIAQQVRQAADDRGLGPYLEDVAIVVESPRS